MTPFATRQQQIIGDKSLTFTRKLELITDDIANYVRDNPRSDCSPLLHTIILLRFTIDSLRWAGYDIGDKDIILGVCLRYLVSRSVDESDDVD